MIASIVQQGARVRRLSGLFLVSALAWWVGPAGAACLSDNDAHACVTITKAQSTAQPSGVNTAGNKTHVRYEVEVDNVGPSNTITLTLALSPATTFRSVTLSGFESGKTLPAACTKQNVTSYSCAINKQTNPQKITFDVIADAPTAAPSTLTLSAKLAGGHGNETDAETATTDIKITSGTTLLMPGETALLVTDAKAADPSQQVTAAKPVWASVQVTNTTTVAELVEFYITLTGPDLSSSCLLGYFYLPSGQAYYCNDVTPILPILVAGNGRRWVALKTNLNFVGSNLAQYTIAHDSSVMNQFASLGLGLAKYGTFTTFGPNDQNEFSEITVTETPTQRFGNDTFTSFAATNVPPAPPQSMNPLQHLYALMNFVVEPVAAQITKPGVRKR